MAAAVHAGADPTRCALGVPRSGTAPRSAGARLARALLLGLGLLAAPLANPAAAQSNGTAILAPGEAVVTGFSGIQTVTPTPQGVDPAALTFIDPAGPSARIIDLRNAGGPPQAQVLPAPKPFTATAGQVGQVFGVALDNASPPNIYLAASSAYGLPIVLPAVNPADPPQRLTDGAPGAAFMPGLFGPPAMQGGPGSIWRVDGASGQVTLFANVTLDSAPNSGPALGGLAFDSASNSLFVADRDTGMIHRFALTGAEIGRYDHGKDGRTAAGLIPVPFDPAKRLDITSPNFHSQDRATWGYAPPERRIFGLAPRGGRLYYAVGEALMIWSVAILPNGGFGSDARIEFQVPPGQAPSDISKIIFDDRGRMELAERGAPTGAFDFQALAQPATSRVLRYRLLQTDAKSPPTWQVEPDEYAIGFAADLRNSNGGIAVGYGYRADGGLDTGACGAFLWTTGEQLRNASDPALAADLAKSGPLPLNGLQGEDIEAVRPDNVPPLTTYFANYFDDSGDATFRGHLGDIAIPRCGQGAALPTPATLIPWWPGGPPVTCPVDYIRRGDICRLPPPVCASDQRGGGVQCCPQGTAPGLDGMCEPLRGGNFSCPLGAAPIKRPDGAIQCLWLARCPDGAQADLHGRCERYCPPGEIGWPSRKCCGDGEIGLPDGKCCPERDVHDGKCVQACPTGDIRLPDGQCCSRSDVHDGNCVQACPDGAIRLPDGQCCPRSDVHDGKCVQACPTGDIRLPDGQCCPRSDVHDGKCVQACPTGDIRLPDGQCCPRSDVHDGKCQPPCPNGEPRAPDGQCVKTCLPGFHAVGALCIRECPTGEAVGPDNLCHRVVIDRCENGLTMVNGACVDRREPRREPVACGPGRIRLPNGLCAPFVAPTCPPGQIKLPNGRCVLIAPQGPPRFRPPDRGGPVFRRGDEGPRRFPQ